MKKKIKLDKEEQQIFEDFENGNLNRISNLKKEKQELENAARHPVVR